MPSEWNKFVVKIFNEGRAKDPNYKFKQALVDASKRKSEMGKSSSDSSSKSHTKMSSKRHTRKSSRSSRKKHGGKSRRHRK